MYYLHVSKNFKKHLKEILNKISKQATFSERKSSSHFKLSCRVEFLLFTENFYKDLCGGEFQYNSRFWLGRTMFIGKFTESRNS